MITMKGAAVSAKLKEQVEKELETLTWVPKLTIIRVGENPDDISYEKGATKKLTSFGLEVESKVFPGDISDEAFKKEFAAINADASVDGILMLRPLPKQINEQDIEKMIDPAKDLDGISPVNIAKVFSGDTSGFAPCTAEAVVCMLKMNDIALSGKRVAVVGRSMVVGRPLSMLLLHENATVTICHSRTASLPRNLAVIIEVAAMNNRQKKMGYNAARELLKNLGMAVEDLPPSPKVIVDTWE